jgi:proteasome lid subunit RPN8/RPN11
MEGDAMGKKEILKIRCSDGRSRKPGDIRGNWVHEIRQPGGILFPDLCALSISGSEQTSEMTMLFAIDTMVALKKPEEIILVYHTHCGAADVMNFSESDVRNKHLAWKKRLSERYPGVTVRVLKESHSECGENHFGHEELWLHEVA